MTFHRSDRTLRIARSGQWSATNAFRDDYPATRNDIAWQSPRKVWPHRDSDQWR